MKDFKFSSLILCPVRRAKIKKSHYKCVLTVASVLILAAHFYAPEFESHVAVAVNLLFIVDPTA